MYTIDSTLLLINEHLENISENFNNSGVNINLIIALFSVFVALSSVIIAYKAFYLSKKAFKIQDYHQRIEALIKNYKQKRIKSNTGLEYAYFSDATYINFIEKIDLLINKKTPYVGTDTDFMMEISTRLERHFQKLYKQMNEISKNGLLDAIQKDIILSEYVEKLLVDGQKLYSKLLGEYYYTGMIQRKIQYGKNEQRTIKQIFSPVKDILYKIHVDVLKVYNLSD